MGLDIRLPLGLLFLVTGCMMAVYGLFTHGSVIYEKSLGIDINLIWGLILSLFGLSMLLLAFLARRRLAAVPPTIPSSEEAQPTRPRGH
jgi:cytochrome c-type biogenesis protein CcmH/NrfF